MSTVVHIAIVYFTVEVSLGVVMVLKYVRERHREQGFRHSQKASESKNPTDRNSPRRLPA